MNVNISVALMAKYKGYCAATSCFRSSRLYSQFTGDVGSLRCNVTK